MDLSLKSCMDVSLSLLNHAHQHADACEQQSMMQVVIQMGKWLDQSWPCKIIEAEVSGVRRCLRHSLAGRHEVTFSHRDMMLWRKEHISRCEASSSVRASNRQKLADDSL